MWTTAHIHRGRPGQQTQANRDGLVSDGHVLPMPHRRLLHHHPILRGYRHLLAGGVLRDLPACPVPPLLLQEPTGIAAGHRRGGPDSARHAAYILSQAEAGLGADHHIAAVYGELPDRIRRVDHSGGDHRHLPDTIGAHQRVLRNHHHGDDWN